MEELVKLLSQQLEEQQRQHKEEMSAQLEEQRRQHKEEMAALFQEQQMQRYQHLKEMEALMSKIDAGQQKETTVVQSSAIPSFSAFEPTSELWTDYWSRFCTFIAANAVPDSRKAQVFLTNQSSSIYKQLANLAAQQSPPKGINDLSMDEIVNFMKDQFDPKRFIVRERFKFWSDMQRKPGESLQELAARIRQDAATCDFASIKDPQDEALRQRFICSVNNEAVLKALFKIKDDELNFARAVQVAIETEDAAKVAKETVYGPKS